MKSKSAPTELDLAAIECGRLSRLEKLPDHELLDGALNGAERSIASVTALMTFIAKYMPRGIPTAHWSCAVRREADAFDRWWGICTDYLTANNAPVPPKPPAAGEPDFVSVLSEFED